MSNRFKRARERIAGPDRYRRLTQNICAILDSTQNATSHAIPAKAGMGIHVYEHPTENNPPSHSEHSHPLRTRRGQGEAPAQVEQTDHLHPNCELNGATPNPKMERSKPNLPHPGFQSVQPSTAIGLALAEQNGTKRDSSSKSPPLSEPPRPFLRKPRRGFSYLAMAGSKKPAVEIAHRPPSLPGQWPT